MVIHFKLSYLDRTKMIILGVILKNNKQNKTKNKHISFRGSSVMWLFKNKLIHTHTHTALTFRNRSIQNTPHLQRAELYMTLEEGQSQTSAGEKMRQPGNRRYVMEGSWNGGYFTGSSLSQLKFSKELNP